LSCATAAIFAAVLLVYVSGSFLVADLAGVKRELQVLLIAPLVLAAAYYWINRPARLLDPLVAFVIVKTVTEVFLRGEMIWILDSVAALLALTVIFAAPAASVRKGGDLLVRVVGAFALLALLQGVWLFLFPELGEYRLVLSDDGVIQSTVQHPIAVLGLFGDQQYTLFGQPVARLQSFAREPSLVVAYFLVPAALAFLRGSRPSTILGTVILAFCALSLSGSIYLSMAFAAIWWLMLFVLPLRMGLIVGLSGLTFLYLFVIRTIGLEPLVQGISFVARYGDFLNKGASLTNRTTSAAANLDTALALPFGSSTHPDLPGPWLVNSSLEAGWLGAALLLVFLLNLAGELRKLHRNTSRFDAAGVGAILLLGAMSTIVVFNDYQMSNYAGVVLLGLVYRFIQVRNDTTNRPSLATARVAASE
jgi:hypothetical protein